ncbi:MAG: 1-acyl-sn-glycerol-3-phosphate acyltransferase [Gammaproteobacteria bacterium]|nr:1-acyl-sn-glycerol-3-phosphate acyltransferase [Gammaproteobacteria bacterium]
MTSLRSFVFLLLCFLMLLPYSVAVVLLIRASPRVIYSLGSSYATVMNRLLKVLCDIDVEVEGRENLPNVPCVALIKHSSPWETLALFLVIPPSVIVLKRELMWIPIFGWALASLRSIAINRKAGRSAMGQILVQGKNRLQEGLWVNIFPEGTRVPKGQVGRFGIGGAVLACEARARIVPVAHNAGDHWPSGKLKKIPGKITLRIGPAIDTSGKTPEQINIEARTWMVDTMKEISPAHHNPTT